VVGFGMPAQEKWILENWNSLNVHIVFPVGAFFDYLAGDVVRAPRWMTDHGLEWLGRLLIEPRRLWKRYVIGNPLFIWRVLLQKLKMINRELPFP
jgi:N-acetylglucosaminyldiphosphoundecaprenol N-acetyl-beta-D-mannosaminyltransferase